MAFFSDNFKDKQTVDENIFMWFKNVRFYTLDLGDTLNTIKDEAKVEELLAKTAFRPCEANEQSSIGFAPLFGSNTPFHFSTGNNHFLKLVEETKLLPSQVVKTQVDEQVQKKELELKRVLNKQEIETVKAAVSNSLLSKAFATRKELLIWFNTQANIVGISASSAKRAEGALAMLRETFMSFGAKLLAPKCVVEARMTTWIKENTLPEKFDFGSEVTLKSTDEDGGIIRASKEDLTSQEIAVHLDAGKNVYEIALNYDDAVTFSLTNDLTIKKVKPTDIYLEHNLPNKVEDEIADAQSLLILQGEIFTELCSYIMEIFDCDRT